MDEAVRTALPAAAKPFEEEFRYDGQRRAQYLGIVRDGKKFVYASYHPIREEDEEIGLDWNEPVSICHGGPNYFGAEYDIETGEVTHLAFNDWSPY